MPAGRPEPDPAVFADAVARYRVLGTAARIPAVTVPVLGETVVEVPKRLMKYLPQEELHAEGHG
jgi:hypothetical protein